MTDINDLKNRFGYHAPKDDGVKKTHARIRALHYATAIELNAYLPDGREKALVMTKLEESMMWANAAIARMNPITEDPA
jgi:hypothetical protein